MNNGMESITREKIKQAIPAECFQSSASKSLAYFARDVVIIAILWIVALYLDSWFFYPFFWFMFGTMLWAIFVVGHDCGHGGFSNYHSLNYLVGHLCHSILLVPFHSWKVTHRDHHCNTASFENEGPFALPSYSEYKNLDYPSYLMRFKFFLLGHPLYLLGLRNTRLKHMLHENHFYPGAKFFTKHDRFWVAVSAACCLFCLMLYIALGIHFGAKFALNFIIMPLIVYNIWLSFVTFLHHSSPELPTYRASAWDSLLGALSTMDYDYGIFNPIHHHINTHVIHHIFPTIPHYNLIKATEAAKPLLGDHYRKSPHSPLKSFLISYQQCHFVDDEGEVVFPKRKL